MKLHLTINIFVMFVLGHQLCTGCSTEYKSRTDGTCCKPTTCEKGEGFTLCKGNTQQPGEDSCFQCPSGTYNQDIINTGEMDFDVPVCQPLDCSCDYVGSKITNYVECMNGQSKICICDRQKMYYGEDPMACRKASENLKARIEKVGFELTNRGTVEPCETGYFKSKADLSICIKHKTCSQGYILKEKGTSSTDVLCEKVLQNSEDISSDTDSSGNHNITTKPEEDNSSTQGIDPKAVIILVVALVCIFSILVIIAYRYRGRLQCIPRLTERWKARFCSRPGDIEENIYSEPSNPQIARDNRPQKGSEQAELLRNDDSMDTSSMSSYVRGADIDHGLLASVGEDDDVDTEETTTKTVTDSTGPSRPSTNCQSIKPTGRVTPSIRPLCQDPGPENINVTVRVGGPIRSPEQEDRGELVVAGMRADGEDSNQELDSGVGELV
ncbi:uncharacterized protein LOC111128477 [Crassostrea virginica]